jgi:hypothetical protein
MAFPDIRKFIFQNPASGKVYDVALTRAQSGDVSGRARLHGVNKMYSSPESALPETPFVVLTTHAAKVFASSTTDAQLWQLPAYHGSNRAAPPEQSAALAALLA